MAAYYDPMFYISSDKMPFTIRIEIRLKDRPADGEALSRALNTAAPRYPYFAVRVEAQGDDLVAVPNSLPLVAYPGPAVHPLGGDEVNGHLVAASYLGNTLYFYASHVITDGAGFFPFVKTVLYYYLCETTGTELDPTGIRLVSEPFYDDELGNPYPEAKMAAAEPFSTPRKADIFRLSDAGLVTDDEPTVFRFRIAEKELMQFNYDHDGSPCALLSSLMAKAIWATHPEAAQDIVSAVSFNLRPGLGNRHSYRMLCSALNLVYPAAIRDWEIARLCTATRGMITLQSQPENVLYYARGLRERMEQFLTVPGIAKKKRTLGDEALRDCTDNTFSVSYVGKLGLGSLEPYIESIYNLTDGSTYRTVFIEISAAGGFFDISFLQGFSSDVYYRALLRELDRYGLHYTEEEKTPMGTPKMVLP